jgi:hypothetical protein
MRPMPPFQSCTLRMARRDIVLDSVPTNPVAADIIAASTKSSNLRYISFRSPTYTNLSYSPFSMLARCVKAAGCRAVVYLRPTAR